VRDTFLAAPTVLGRRSGIDAQASRAHVWHPDLRASVCWLIHPAGEVGAEGKTAEFVPSDGQTLRYTSKGGGYPPNPFRRFRSAYIDI